MSYKNKSIIIRVGCVIFACVFTSFAFNSLEAKSVMGVIVAILFILVCIFFFFNVKRGIEVFLPDKKDKE